MDLLTIIANEFEIPIIRSNQKIWFFRTKAGRYYYDFYHNGFIALGWDLVSPELITNDKTAKDAKKGHIERLYPAEKRPGLILGQLEVFYNEMSLGDLVVIPAEGGKEIAIGTLGEVTKVVKHNNREKDDYPQCSFCHRRNVVWLKKVDTWQDIYLFKALRAQQTISDITDDAKLILRNLFPVFISGDTLHMTLQKSTAEDLSLACNVDLLSNFLNITDTVSALYGQKSFRDELLLKTAVGSPGFFEMILPNIPIALISVGLTVRVFIGKEKSADGVTTSGILAVVSKINELINDYHKRKKIDAETKQIDAATDLALAQAIKTYEEIEESRANAAKSHAEAEFLKAQAAKANAEARQIELQNKQIMLLPTGQTNEDARISHEQLSIPGTEMIAISIPSIQESGCKICEAAARNGVSFDGKKIEKII